MLKHCPQLAARFIRLPSQPVLAAPLPNCLRGFDRRRWFATDPGSQHQAGPGLGERAKIATANALLKSLLSSTNGFDSAFNGLSIVRMGEGEISCSLDVDKKLEVNYPYQVFLLLLEGLSLKMVTRLPCSESLQFSTRRRDLHPCRFCRNTCAHDQRSYAVCRLLHAHCSMLMKSEGSGVAKRLLL